MGQSGFKPPSQKRSSAVNCLMPSKALYLKKPGEFKQILKKGKAFRSNFFILYAIPFNKDTSQGRLGISVSKAAVPTAVQRNRIKRLAREIWRTLPKEKIVKDIVLIVKKGTDAKENRFIVKEITYNLNKVLS